MRKRDDLDRDGVISTKRGLPSARRQILSRQEHVTSREISKKTPVQSHGYSGHLPLGFELDVSSSELQS